MVNIHAHTMDPATPQRTAENFCADPTPTMAPVMVCVVETGTPRLVARKRVAAPLAEAQKPPTGRSLVMRMPMVRTMRHPPSKVPSAMAAWQASTTHSGRESVPEDRSAAINSIQIMPMVFWASLLPCPRLYNAAETYCAERNQRSTRRGVERENIHDMASMSRMASAKPSAGDSKIAAEVLTNPLATSVPVPPLATAAPPRPPMSACEELDGMP